MPYPLDSTTPVQLWPPRGGVGSYTWHDLKNIEQSTGGPTAILPYIDAVPYRLSGGHNILTGKTELALQNAATNIGYQQNVLAYTALLNTVLEGEVMSWDNDILVIRIIRGSTPRGTSELNLWAGLLDGLPSGTVSGAAGFWGQSTAGADVSGIMNATTGTFSAVGGQADEVYLFIQVSDTGAGIETRIMGRNKLTTGKWSGGANWGAGQALSALGNNLRIAWGVAQRTPGTDNLTGISTVGFQVRVARVPLGNLFLG